MQLLPLKCVYSVRSSISAPQMPSPGPWPLPLVYTVSLFVQGRRPGLRAHHGPLWSTVQRTQGSHLANWWCPGSRLQVRGRAGSSAGSTSRAHADCFHAGTGVWTAVCGTDSDRSTSWYLWM